MHFLNAAESMSTHSGNELLWKSHLMGKGTTLQHSAEKPTSVNAVGRWLERVPVQAFFRAYLCIILATRGQLVSVHKEDRKLKYTTDILAC